MLFLDDLFDDDPKLKKALKKLIAHASGENSQER